jgi:hypothetical protein
MLNMFINKYMTLSSKVVDRNNYSSPTNEQNSASPSTKKRKIDDSSPISSSSHGNSSERSGEIFWKESPTSKESCKRFQEENKHNVMRIVMRTDPSDSSLVSGINNNNLMGYC